MKKKLLLFICIIAIFSSVFIGQSVASAMAIECSSYTTKTEGLSCCLVEYETGKVLFENGADNKRPIASMVKVMTLLLSFEAIDNGIISLDTPVVISQNASDMGGSQMFIEAGDTYTVDQLIKGIVMVSANDASVQMAELISGSVDSFVVRMNERATELGLVNTHFANCTGLPSENEQYCTARDISVIFRQLLTHELYFNYSRSYMEDFNHPDGRVTEFVNTNKLVRFYKDCDGGKTGFTNEAMFCLTSTAKRDGMRVIATVVGAPDSKTRFAEATSMLNYAFANFGVEKIIGSEPIENNIAVEGGKSETITVAPKEEISVLIDKSNRQNYSVNVEMPEKLSAPIAVGDTIGTITVTDETGAVIGQTELVSKDEILEKNYFDALKKVLENWNLLRR